MMGIPGEVGRRGPMRPRGEVGGRFLLLGCVVVCESNDSIMMLIVCFIFHGHMPRSFKLKLGGIKGFNL